MPRRQFRELADDLAAGSYAAADSTTASVTWDQLKVAALVDIMQSLRAMRRRLDCHETLEIPRRLKALEHLAREFWVKPRKRRKKARKPQA